MLTIVIAARNAAATIGRAVESAAAEADCPLILVDDQCTDDTVERARTVAGSRLHIVRTASPGGVAAARQRGLVAVQTDYAAWLDADDEWIPGRGARLATALDDGHDVATEEIGLVDGPTNRPLRQLAIPPFLRREVVPARLFERNYLPGDTQVAFRTAVFREAGGYDPAVHGVESFDLLLRAVARGARFHYGATVGYRMFAYPGSVSRNLDRQRASLAIALRKHTYADVRRLCLQAGETPRISAWVLVAMALYRNEPAAALGFIDDACPATADPTAMLEPDGPLPVPEGWRRDFTIGTCQLLLGRPADAEPALARAEVAMPTPEGANNLGVALLHLGRRAEAESAWQTALARFPEFADPKANLSGIDPRVTTHPLRRQPSRSEYTTPNQ